MSTVLGPKNVPKHCKNKLKQLYNGFQGPKIGQRFFISNVTSNVTIELALEVTLDVQNASKHCKNCCIIKSRFTKLVPRSHYSPTRILPCYHNSFTGFIIIIIYNCLKEFRAQDTNSHGFYGPIH